jgi:hypothetical protein
MLVLFERHRLGLTQHEICGFTSLSSQQAGACLAQLAAAGMISSEPYARGRLWAPLRRLRGKQTLFIAGRS